MTNKPNDMARNQLARLLAGAGIQTRLALTGDSGDTGTDLETVVNTLPDFTTAGYVLQLVVNGDGDLVASWENVAGTGASAKYRQFMIELDGSGGFDFILDTDGSPIMDLRTLE